MVLGRHAGGRLRLVGRHVLGIMGLPVAGALSALHLIQSQPQPPIRLLSDGPQCVGLDEVEHHIGSGDRHDAAAAVFPHSEVARTQQPDAQFRVQGLMGLHAPRMTYRRKSRLSFVFSVACTSISVRTAPLRMPRGCRPGAGSSP